jgi:NADH-quinone oxidoreductase subunit C
MSDTDTDTGTEPEPAAEPAAEPAVPPDPLRESIVAALRGDLGDALLEYVNSNGDLWVRLDRDAWQAAGLALRNKHGFDYFCFLSGIDWLQSAELASRYEAVWDPEGDDATTAYVEGRVAGGETRFQVIARVYDTDRKLGITLKADLDDADPRVATWADVYRGADWHEREAWEMFGFQFDGHPGLRHIYLPAEFEGFPLRKDFPLLSRVVKPWPGLVDKEPVPGEEEDEEAAEEGATA